MYLNKVVSILGHRITDHYISRGAKSIQINVRESIGKIGKKLPVPIYNGLQRFFTWLTGKPLKGQTAFFSLTPWNHATINFLVFIVGTILIYFSLNHFTMTSPLLILIGWIMNTHSSRKLFLVLCHAGIHESFSDKKIVNKLFVDISSLFICTLPYEQFKQDHSSDHHFKHFSHKGDPDADVLYKWVGLRPNKTLNELYISVFRSIFSPAFHTRYFIARVTSNLTMKNLSRSILFISLYSMVIYLSYINNLFLLFIFSWFIPVILGFQAAALVTFAGEHKWFQKKKENQTRTEWKQQQTSARFMGEIYPDNSSIINILTWWLKLFLWYLPLRLLVVPGDMPVHDFHHDRPRGDWTNALYAREKWIIERNPLHSETWGLFTAMNNALTPLTHSTEIIKYN